MADDVLVRLTTLAPGDSVVLALASGDVYARVVELRDDGAVVVDLFGTRWLARGTWAECVRTVRRLVVASWEPWRVAPPRRPRARAPRAERSPV